MRQLEGWPACLRGPFRLSALEAQKPAVAKAPAKAASGAPKIEVVPETKDAGTVAKGNVVDAVFVVKNSGGADLVISDARPSCGCTVASFDRVIKPGAEGKIKSSVDTKSFSGPISIDRHSLERSRAPADELFIKARSSRSSTFSRRRSSASRPSRATRRPGVILLSEERLPPDDRRGLAALRQGRDLPAGDKDKIPAAPATSTRSAFTSPDAPEGL